jgi:hypothetical protein
MYILETFNRERKSHFEKNIILRQRLTACRSDSVKFRMFWPIKYYLDQSIVLISNRSAVFDNIVISCLDPMCTHLCILEENAHRNLIREMAPTSN